jgi:hypothetical protein
MPAQFEVGLLLLFYQWSVSIVFIPFSWEFLFPVLIDR